MPYSLRSAAPSSPARYAGLLLACLLTACTLLATQPAHSAGAARPLQTGISYLHVDSHEPLAFERVKATGSRLVLTPVEWGLIVPEQRPVSWQPENPADPHYDWDSYDLWVKNAVASGLTPVLQIRGGPSWAQRCPFTSVDTPCDLNPADLAAFATAAARRYSGTFGGLPRVQYWQGLNEPNLSIFFEPQFVNGKPVSAELYRTLLNTFYASVKAVDPTNLVIAAGLGPIAVPKFTVGPMQFTRELLCMKGHAKPRPAPGNCGGGVNFDIFDIHPYTTGGPSHEGGPNDVQLGDLAKLQTLLKAADKANRINSAYKRTPLWITEISWDSNPPDPGGLPFPILNRWTAEMLHEAWSAGVGNVFWYSLHDRQPEAGVPFHISLESGLYFAGPTLAQDQPKPNLYAFRFPFVAYAKEKGGLSLWGRTPNSLPGKVLIERRDKGSWRTVRSIRANAVGIFRGSAKTSYGQDRKGAVRARYKGINSVPFSMRPVRDFFQPPFGKPVG